MMLKLKPTIGRRRLTLQAVALVQALLVMFAGTAASAQEGNRLQDIQVQSLSGQRIELKLIMSETAPEPLAFTIENPARIALDLPGTTLGLSQRRRDVNQGPLDTILTAEANGRTRVVLNLDLMVPYETKASGNTITVTLGDGDDYDAGSTQFASSPSSTSSSPSYAAPGGRAITNVDFRRTRDGGGRVVVSLTDPGTPVDIRQEGARVVAIFKDTSLPAELMRRLDVMDFATPVATVDTLKTNLDTRIVISAEGKYDQLAYQSDNEFSIEINPVPDDIEEASGLYSESKEYEGQRLTLNFQDIETRAVLQLLAETSGRNIVVSDTVQGNVTLRLRNVPWDQALDIVMTTKGLDMRQNGNVIIVAPAEEIAARETADLEARNAISELEPMYSEFLQVNYAKASDLSALIGADTGGGMLSERGSIAVDDRTNTLLVQDTADRLEDIRRMVRALDVPIKQVLIESRIVVVNDDFSRDLGVRLGVTGYRENGTDGAAVISGTGTGTDTMVNSIVDNLGTTGQITPVELPILTDRYNVNVPIAEAAGRFSLAVLERDYLVDLELTALEAEGRGEIVSTPRVITANQKQARIEQGVEIPYQQSASSGATTVQFKKAVLSLEVTPQITPDNNIIMDLRVHKDNVGDIISTGGLGGTVPSIDTRAVETQVLVEDGQTVVLGGIYETERRETITKVPFLGDIPAIGVLFRSKQLQNDKSELLIFVTPRILEEGSTIY
ncbi:MAG: type IV pilus secretin PilQ [Gammaproteobacteria bacterium]|jgi:type IV pilus assembly protein PilQ|nr:type IV pilus secretin PilQ [Gammaproteobacteria bacterium]MDH3847395.1 type IV pilus secretin PilQ [Gammaproteobacteria bacterium]MDH3864246.1 type IV pilus secretin PilQ [Gammaproteobacteria bacterium]MDH3904949.1 type IV pilus secretin PilQ [Gammaproteobacteria bacterium]MDH3952824.1 type IV pilus secretin PilQ [Gammaproteobacteria bacterium]